MFRKLTMEHEPYEIPPGGWSDEPNRLDFKHVGLDCLILRAPLGHLCGYVGLKADHPSFAKHYDQVDLHVHGGLTYSDYCRDAICHEQNSTNHEKIWWFGFDCAHFNDIVPYLMNCPGLLKLEPGWRKTYKTFKYVMGETESLAEQLAEIRTKHV